MKVNSIGIDSYRQTTGKTQVENRAATENRKQTEQATRIQIPGQGQKIGSDLSIRLRPGTFIDMLSDEERRAFELIFQKFNGLSAGDGVYARRDATNESHLGNYLDVKL